VKEPSEDSDFRHLAVIRTKRKTGFFHLSGRVPAVEFGVRRGNRIVLFFAYHLSFTA
jgi:hypothetical protein